MPSEDIYKTPAAQRILNVLLREPTSTTYRRSFRGDEERCICMCHRGEQIYMRDCRQACAGCFHVRDSYLRASAKHMLSEHEGCCLYFTSDIDTHRRSMKHLAVAAGVLESDINRLAHIQYNINHMRDHPELWISFMKACYGHAALTSAETHRLRMEMIARTLVISVSEKAKVPLFRKRLYNSFVLRKEAQEGKALLDTTVLSPTGQIIRERDNVYWKPSIGMSLAQAYWGEDS